MKNLGNYFFTCRFDTFALFSPFEIKTKYHQGRIFQGMEILFSGQLSSHSAPTTNYSSKHHPLQWEQALWVCLHSIILCLLAYQYLHRREQRQLSYFWLSWQEAHCQNNPVLVRTTLQCLTLQLLPDTPTPSFSQRNQSAVHHKSLGRVNTEANN